MSSLESSPVRWPAGRQAGRPRLRTMGRLPPRPARRRGRDRRHTTQCRQLAPSVCRYWEKRRRGSALAPRRGHTAAAACPARLRWVLWMINVSSEESSPSFCDSSSSQSP